MLADEVVGVADAIASVLSIRDQLALATLSTGEVFDLAERCKSVDRGLTVIRYGLAHELCGRDASGPSSR